MTGLVFVDTNVLLYRFDDVDKVKQARSRAWFETLWDRDLGRVSWQVLVEFYANATRKAKVPSEIERTAIRGLLLWIPEPPNHDTLERAWHWCDSAQVNFWDAMIVASAEQSGCKWLLSEDFQADRRFGDVTVVNPFKRNPSEFGLVSR